MLDQAMRRRSSTDRFDGNELHAALLPFAQLKNPGFDWELGSYAKSRRSQSPDRLGLEKYAPLLSCVLTVAPGGYPNHTALRDVIIGLNAEHGIRSPTTANTKTVLDWANDVADIVRLALKHIVDLKRSNTPYLPPILRDLVNQVRVEPAVLPPIPISWSEPAEPAPLPAPPPRQLAQKDSLASQSSSVICCAVRCQCPACREPEDVAASQSSTASLTSQAARQAEQVPAARGGQKRAAQLANMDPCDEVSKKPAARISQKKPANHTAGVGNQFKIVHRQTPPQRAEAYIKHNSRFLCGISRAISDKYFTATRALVAELVAGTTQPADARERLHELAA